MTIFKDSHHFSRTLGSLWWQSLKTAITSAELWAVFDDNLSRQPSLQQNFRQCLITMFNDSAFFERTLRGRFREKKEQNPLIKNWNVFAGLQKSSHQRSQHMGFRDLQQELGLRFWTHGRKDSVPTLFGNAGHCSQTSWVQGLFFIFANRQQTGVNSSYNILVHPLWQSLWQNGDPLPQLLGVHIHLGQVAELVLLQKHKTGHVANHLCHLLVLAEYVCNLAWSRARLPKRMIHQACVIYSRQHLFKVQNYFAPASPTKQSLRMAVVRCCLSLTSHDGHLSGTLSSTIECFVFGCWSSTIGGLYAKKTRKKLNWSKMQILWHVCPEVWQQKLLRKLWETWLAGCQLCLVSLMEALGCFPVAGVLAFHHLQTGNTSCANLDHVLKRHQLLSDYLGSKNYTLSMLWLHLRQTLIQFFESYWRLAFFLPTVNTARGQVKQGLANSMFQEKRTNSSRVWKSLLFLEGGLKMLTLCYSIPIDWLSLFFV